MALLTDSVRKRMTSIAKGSSEGGKETNPLVVIGLSDAILALPLNDEQLHAAVRNYSRRMAGFQNEQLDQANPAFRLETPEQKARRLQVYEAHSRIDDFNDFQKALKEFKELYAEGVIEENLLRAQSQRVREIKVELQAKLDAIELREMQLNERDGQLKRELVDVEEQKETLRRTVMRTDLQLLLDEEKRKSLKVRSALARFRKMTDTQSRVLDEALVAWLSCAVGRAPKPQPELLEWQNIFSARKMTVLEFTLSFREKGDSRLRTVTAAERREEAAFLCGLSQQAQVLYMQCMQRLTQIVSRKRTTLTRFYAAPKTYTIQNGIFESLYVPAGTGPNATRERHEYERVMGSVPLAVAEKSHYKNFSRLPARLAANNSLPFLVPGHLLVSQGAEVFTSAANTYDELFATLKTLKLKSVREASGGKQKTASTNRILISVE